MKKDIYIIKNDINDKVYIGQSKNPAKRWLNHLYNAKYEYKIGKIKQKLHEDMAILGYEHFHYEILESQIENFDERERYWIKYYNSVDPNGYNVSRGGQGDNPNLDSYNAIFKTEEELNKCIEEISSSKKTFENIAKKYGCSAEVISTINSGKRYKNNNLKYPLRQTRYSDELLKQICYSLKYELDMPFTEIANKYSIDYSQLSEINNGKIHYISSESYPLRKKRKKDLDTEVVDSIRYDINYSDLPMWGIARKYNISVMQVSNINNGISYKDNNILYPIRKVNDPRNDCPQKYLDRDIIITIITSLKNGESVSKIAQDNNLSKTTIQNINHGRCKRYRIEGYKYPIRKMRKTPVSTIRA